MAVTKIRGNTQIQDLTVTNSQIAYPDQATNPVGIELAKIEHGNELIQANGSVPFTAPIAGVAPTQSNHLVTKEYVDNVAVGLDVKQSVRALATGNIVLSGLQSVDGVSLVAGDRVLVTGQTNAADNGIYVVSGGVWARADDANGTPTGSVTSGMFTFIEEGTTKGHSGWVLATPDAGGITVGSTPLEFVQFSEAGATGAGAGLITSGSTINVVSANAGIDVNPDNIELKVSADGSLQIKGDGLALRDVAPGEMLIGDNSGVLVPRTIAGDITIDAAGVSSIGDGKVTDRMLAIGAISVSKLGNDNAPPGSVLVIGSEGVPYFVPATGDITVGDDGSFTINDDSVDGDALANNSVNANKIVDGAVGTSKLADGAVTEDKLADDAVTTDKIADGAVDLTKLTSLGQARIIVGTASGQNSDVVLSGDVTMDESGVVTINPATVVRVADIVKRETPTGLVNGSNAVFTLANTPKAGTEDVYLNGVLQEGDGNDYTISGATITLVFNPEPGDKIRVSYFK